MGHKRGKNMGKLIDLTGKKFGRLTVVGRAKNHISPSGVKNVKWECQCECGNVIDVLSKCLRNGETKSCGCYNIEKISTRRFIDLTGQVFGNLIVIKRGENLITKNRQYVRWECQCKCGNKILVTLTQLKSGKVSCGCMKPHRIDTEYAKTLCGQKFGKLTILSLAERKNNKVCFNCKCDCGVETEVNAYHVVNGITRSCGCLIKEASSKLFLDDLTGKRYGRLLVIKRVDDYIAPSSKKHFPQWLCKCDCGNETIATSRSLKSGNSSSCGCLHNELISKKCLKDITGQRFGKLTVIRRVENGKDRVHWLCKCDCGNEVSILSSSLVSGRTTSCGCVVSFGEYQITQYLLKHNVIFKSQKKFDDLLGIGDGKLSYDFYIPKYNLLIEAQGEQHERPIEIFGGEKQFEIQQEHDRRKREYAENHNYKLFEIWYYDYNNIEEILNNYLTNISQFNCEGKQITC